MVTTTDGADLSVIAVTTRPASTGTATPITAEDVESSRKTASVLWWRAAKRQMRGSVPFGTDRGTVPACAADCINDQASIARSRRS
ncbi:hypothetical protein GCM10023204_54420 [Actinomycetospora succinea]